MNVSSTVHEQPAVRTADAFRSVMRFLNEVADDYPDALSLASGRPADTLFGRDVWADAVASYQKHFARMHGCDDDAAGRRLAQYGRTRGIIGDLIAAQLARDEGVRCDPWRVVVTAGCQEAIALTLQSVCSEAGDVVLARNPTYIGVIGSAALAGIDVAAVDAHADGELPDALRATIARLHAEGKRPRALYLVAEFDNPTGSVLSRAERESVLRICADAHVVVLEDGAYSLFRYEGTQSTPMAELDVYGCVVYLGTYSKTICPTVRVGCAVVPATLFGDAAAARALALELEERKSFAALNTSQFNQALVGGVLLREEGSLRRWIEPTRLIYKRNRDVLLERLAERFSGESRVRWNRPQGGFFLSLELPFVFGAADVATCAGEYGVIVMPMSFFALDDSQSRRVRLAFSSLEPGELATAVDSFGRYVRDRGSR